MNRPVTYFSAIPATPVRGVVVRNPRARRLLTFLMVFVPGLIVMEADNDAGAVSTYMQAGARTPLVLIAWHSFDDELLARVNVKAYRKATGPKEEALERIVTRLSIETGVTAVSWEVAAAVDAEDASISASEEICK